MDDKCHCLPPQEIAILPPISNWERDRKFTIDGARTARPLRSYATLENSTKPFHDGSPPLKYHGGMSHRWPYLAVVSLLLFVPACKKPKIQPPIMVHIFRDLHSPYAHELDHRILDFEVSNPRLPSGAPITVETMHEVDYKEALKGDFNKVVRVEAVILNSSSDIGDNPALAVDLSHAVNICSAVKACPTVVPAFVLGTSSGDQAAAAQVFVNYLSQAK